MSGSDAGPRFGDPAFFGDHYAHEYDERHVLDPAPAVEFLAGLVPDGGRVLELAVGTGRARCRSPPAASPSRASTARRR